MLTLVFGWNNLDPCRGGDSREIIAVILERLAHGSLEVGTLAFWNFAQIYLWGSLGREITTTL